MKSNLSVRELSVGFESGKEARVLIAPISLDVEAGTLIAVVGANGVGKSTLLRTLAGLQKPLSGGVFCEFPLKGEVSLFSLPVKARSSIVCSLFCRSGELPRLSVRDYVSLGRYRFSDFGKETTDAEDKLNQVLLDLSVDGFSERMVCELSDGEFQRVEIARALLQETPVLLLDEPTSHLDYHSRVEIMSLLKRIAKDRGLSVIVSTHELDLAAQYCDQFWIVSSSGGLKCQSHLEAKDVM